jgi:hypothetical protein
MGSNDIHVFTIDLCLYSCICSQQMRLESENVSVILGPCLLIQGITKTIYNVILNYRRSFRDL